MTRNSFFPSLKKYFVGSHEFPSWVKQGPFPIGGEREIIFLPAAPWFLKAKGDFSLKVFSFGPGGGLSPTL